MDYTKLVQITVLKSTSGRFKFKKSKILAATNIKTFLESKPEIKDLLLDALRLILNT